MMEKMKTAMRISISEVLETMFFMSIEFESLPSPESMEKLSSVNTLTCRLDFKGIFSGYFLLSIPEKLLYNMSEDFLGMSESDITHKHIHGTISELINMVVGNTFSHYDNNLEFELDIPQILDSNPTHGECEGSDDNDIFQIIETVDNVMGIKICIKS